VRRLIALAVALSILSSGISGCSQPIDTGSSVPAQSQPLVALLALVGLGIGLTAWHHHNENHHGGGGTPTIFGANFIVQPFISGFKPVDLVPDAINGAIGAIELPTSGTGTGEFTEIQGFSGGSSFGTYTLPVNYKPTAVGMDSNGITWFVDANGVVQACDVMTQTTTNCSSLGTFNDGLGVGSRSIAADLNFVIVIMDAGAGKVKYWVLPTASGSTAATGTYTSTTASPIYVADAIEPTPAGGASGFTAYHQDGTSDIITFTASGSTVIVNNQPSFAFNPAPLVSESNFNQATKVQFYSFTGAPGGAYNLTKYETVGAVGLGHPTVASELIEFNGQVGNPTLAPFVSPLASIHVDAVEGEIWAIDHAGNIVNFTPF